MDRKYRVTLQKEEYIEYLSYQISSSKTMRGYRWFILTSVPAILITGSILLKIKSGLFVTSLIAVALLWILYGAKAVWKRFIRRKIQNKILPKMDIREFKEVVYHFTDQGVEYSENKKRIAIHYQKILALIPLENQFVLHYSGGAILLPYRVFEGEEEMTQFIKEYNLCIENMKKA